MMVYNITQIHKLYFSRIKISNNFVIWIVSNSDNKYERVYMRLICLNKS